MENIRPICVLIGALGGQGGGVLADWLVEAAHSAGYLAQATSTPGVAQRTGATTYYFEIFPEKDPLNDPIFTLFPGTADLDIMAALEPTEAGRALEKGYLTKSTTLITGLDRVFSTAEKMAAGDGTINTKPMMKGLTNATKQVIGLDLGKMLGSGPSAHINCVMFGAIIGTGILPITEDDGRKAIKNKAVAVSTNLEGFDLGLKIARSGGSQDISETDKPYNSPPQQFSTYISQFPENLQKIIGHGISKLLDYQDENYVSLYIKRLLDVYQMDSEPEKHLTEDVAKRLAIWMCFEDVIRVAQLKTRKGRLDRIRRELRVDTNTPLRVTDYFKPGRDEIIGILPPFMSWIVPDLKCLEKGKGLALHIPTGSAFGFGLLKILACLKFLRKKSSQYHEEQDNISVWLNAVITAASKNYELACDTAKLSIWARGYGNVRRNGQKHLEDLFLDWSYKVSGDIEELSAEINQSLLLAHGNPDNIQK